MESISNEIITAQPQPSRINVTKSKRQNEAQITRKFEFPELQEIDELNVEYLNEYLPILEKFGSNQKLRIQNQDATFIYYALEETIETNACVERKSASFKLHITNELAEEILTLHFLMSGSHLNCRCKEIIIHSASGDKISIIKNSRQPFNSNFIITDSDGKTIFKINKSTFCSISMCHDKKKLKYKIIRSDQEKELLIGYIVGENNDQKGILSDTKLKVNFSKDLESNYKAVLIAATCAMSGQYFTSNSKWKNTNCSSHLCSCCYYSYSVVECIRCLMIPCILC